MPGTITEAVYDDNSFENRINERFAPFFRRLEKKLNRCTMPYGELQPGNIYHIPQIQGLGDGITRIPVTDGAFNLNPPSAGAIRDVQITEADKNKLIMRSAIGYAGAYNMLNEPDFEKACKSLTLITTQMIMKLEKEIGYKYNELHAGTCYAQFRRHGYDLDTYLVDLPESAAYEIRLYSDTYPMINHDMINAAELVHQQVVFVPR